MDKLKSITLFLKSVLKLFFYLFILYLEVTVDFIKKNLLFLFFYISIFFKKLTIILDDLFILYYQLDTYKKERIVFIMYIFYVIILVKILIL